MSGALSGADALRRYEPSFDTVSPVSSPRALQDGPPSVLSKKQSPASMRPDDGVQNTSQKGRFDRNECETCKNRKYQDGSNDPGVSFKTAAHIAPEAAASTVRGHEMEHVVRERAKANREGRDVVNQRVVLHTGICPECGRPYISGGTTYTTTRAGDTGEVLQNLQKASEEKQNA
ncbi:MAG: hypothetical protein Q4G07_01070 [Oscillospiraceae bacterium]|nr:hypothetical protein [Oscillospiraceae bacterium]